MANARRSHRLPKPNRRRALTLLASSRDGCTEAIMMAHGFTVEQLAELVQTGLAIASPQRTLVGRRTVEVVRLRITDAGRRVLADHPFYSARAQ
jgi:hypothetical protein